MDRIPDMKLSRRTFLKSLAAGSAAASAAMLVPGLSLGEEKDAVTSASLSSMAFATDKDIVIQSPRGRDPL